MRKSEMSDKELEALLRAIPKVKDHRDPRDIYQNVILKMNKRKNKTWVLPSLATAAAILLFVFFAPNLMNWQNVTEEASDKSTASQENMEMAKLDEEQPEESQAEESLIAMDKEAEGKMNTFDIDDSYTAVYESDQAGNFVFTYPIPDRNVQSVIPISVVAPQKEDRTKFEQFEEMMLTLKEEEWGLSEYYPLNAKLTINEAKNILNVDLPSSHFYGDGSASELAFTKVLSDAANLYGIEKITLSTDGKPGMMMGNYGNIDTIPISEDGNHGYYFYFPDESYGKPYLVPSRDPFDNIEEALNAMKSNIDTEGLQASVPADLNTEEVIESGNLLVIRLGNSSNLTENSITIPMIEAILLTAKDFQFDKVKIESGQLDKIGKFVFNEEWSVPIAPNKVTISE